MTKRVSCADIEKHAAKSVAESERNGYDGELNRACIQLIRDTGRISASALQRRLRIGYRRAAHLLDILEAGGFVGPPRGATPREILIDLDAEMPNEADGPRDGARGPEA